MLLDHVRVSAPAPQVRVSTWLPAWLGPRPSRNRSSRSGHSGTTRAEQQRADEAIHRVEMTLPLVAKPPESRSDQREVSEVLLGFGHLFERRATFREPFAFVDLLAGDIVDVVAGSFGADTSDRPPLWVTIVDVSVFSGEPISRPPALAEHLIVQGHRERRSPCT